MTKRSRYEDGYAQSQAANADIQRLERALGEKETELAEAHGQLRLKEAI